MEIICRESFSKWINNPKKQIKSNIVEGTHPPYNIVCQIVEQYIESWHSIKPLKLLDLKKRHQFGLHYLADRDWKRKKGRRDWSKPYFCFIYVLMKLAFKDIKKIIFDRDTKQS